MIFSRQGLRHAEGVAATIWLSLSTYLAIHGEAAMSTVAFDQVKAWLPPGGWAVVGIFASLAHMAAIYVNGHDLRWTPFLRFATCLVGFTFFATLTTGFASVGATTAIPTYAVVSGIYAIGAVVAAIRGAESLRELQHGASG